MVSPICLTTDVRDEQVLERALVSKDKRGCSGWNRYIPSGIGFNQGEKIDVVATGIPFDVVYTLEINRWNNKESLQLNIKDVREVVLS